MTIPTTVLGLGPMGRALAAALLAAGHPTTVWNRTPGKATDLLARGASTAATVGEAARGVVVACLRDYDAVRELLDPVPAWDGTLVNLTSGDPRQAERLAGWAAERGLAYLDGAILTPAPTIATPAATVLYSGPEPVYQRVRPVLAAFGGTGRHLGPEPGRAAAFEVALLDLFVTAVHGLVHSFVLAAAEGVPAGELAPYAGGIGALLPELATRFAGQIDAGVHPGEVSTIASARAGIGHVLDAATGHGLDVGALRAAAWTLDRAVAAGHGDRGLSALAQHVPTRR